MSKPKRKGLRWERTRTPLGHTVWCLYDGTNHIADVHRSSKTTYTASSYMYGSLAAAKRAVEKALEGANGKRS